MNPLPRTTLLIVDSTIDARPFISQTLRNLVGDVVTLRRNSIQFFHLKKGLTQSQSLAVCNMPLEDGLILLGRMRKSTCVSKIRTVVITGAATRQLVETLARNEVDELLVTPFSAATISRKIAIQVLDM